MSDVSGFGLRLRVVGSVTFPSGFDVTQFADDTDPFDMPVHTIGDSAMGLNGDLVTWAKANPVQATVAVVPNSDDDRNLAVLFEANRPGKGKRPAGDVITITAIYPDGRTATATGGKLISGIPSDSIASAGRRKSKPYAFVFENLVRT